MIKEVEITVEPSLSRDEELILKKAAKTSGLPSDEIKSIRIRKRSIDGRSKIPVYRFLVMVSTEDSLDEKETVFNPVTRKDSPECYIIGSGPAGLFAALRALELGFRPIVFDRGKDVRARRRDLRNIMQEGLVNPESNYCFGEGGAGTYSDGKLYTRATKRGDTSRILELMVLHGADPEILIDSHPHIGSNKLPKMVEALRETIIHNGGEVHFNSRLTDIIINDNKVESFIINGSNQIKSDSLLLATGHSARDVYYLLNRAGISIEAKEFAAGVRIEHPQPVIDRIQYHSEERSEFLPAASYSLSCNLDGRGVYSFCMCPGGIIVPATTEPDTLVLNGMSVSKRNSPFANSGLVVTIGPNEWKKFEGEGVFAGLQYQSELEENSFRAGGGGQSAPAQRAVDFLNSKISTDLPLTSYIPGIKSAPLHEILPSEISTYLHRALKQFGSKMRGFLTADALLLATESRTSSPIRIPRDKTTLMSISTEGLFPSGEGAGYAGGIISAAIDGTKSAEAFAKWYSGK